MIKFRASLNGRSIVTLCLEEVNIERLKAGKPIRVYQEDLNIPIDIIVLYGKDKAAIIADLRKNGVELPPENTWVQTPGASPEPHTPK